MTHLILHIGTPKTGTTSIQSFINQEYPNIPLEILESCGGLSGFKLLSIPSFGGDVAIEFYDKIPRKYRLKSLGDIDWSAVDQEVSEKKLSGRPFFVSEEHFYSVYDRDSIAINALAKRLKSIFDRVTILIYLRDQRDYVKSIYSQLAKRGRTTESFKNFVGDTQKLHDLCDYATRLDLWARAFGTADLEVVPFHKEAFFEQNFLIDILTRLNALPLDLRQRASTFKLKNSSPTWLQLELLRIGAKIGINPKLRRRWLGNRHIRKLSDASLPQIYDDRILSVSGRCNAYINQVYLKRHSVNLPLPAVFEPQV